MKKNLLLSLVCLLSFSNLIYGQISPTISWTKKMGATTQPPGSTVRTQRGNEVCIPSSGGFLVVGTSIAGTGDVHGFQGGLSDGWVVRLSEDGDTLWTRSYGGSGSDAFYAVQESIDGGFIIGGTSLSTDGDLINVAAKGTSNAVWLLHIDSVGNILQQVRLGGPQATGHDPTGGSYKYPLKIIEKANGAVVMATTFNATGLDISIPFQGGNSDIWMLELNAALDTIHWQKGFGGTGVDAPRALKSTKDGGFVIAAHTTVGDGTVPPLNGGSDYWLIKTDSVGDVIWQQTYGGVKADNARDVLPTTDGGYLVAGQSNSVDGDVQNPLPGGTLDIWLIKTDSAGTIIWDRGIGTNTKPSVLALDPVDDVYTVLEDIDGNFVIAAEIKGAADTVDGKPGNYYYNGFSSSTDAWLLKLSNDGQNVIWERNFGGTNFDYAIGFQQKRDGSYIFCGNTASIDHDIIGFSGSGGIGSHSLWVTKLNACPFYSYEEATICKGDSYSFGGSTFTTAGVYWDTLSMLSGCDSLIKLTLTVDSIVQPVIAANGNVLGTGSYTSYQWLDSSNEPINGANGQTFETALTGNYKVVVTGANGCSDTSESYNHTPVGVTDLSLAKSIRIYPNPSRDIVFVNISGYRQDALLTLSSVDGKEMMRKAFTDSNAAFSIKELPSGLYFLKISTDKGAVISKLIKQ